MEERKEERTWGPSGYNDEIRVLKSKKGEALDMRAFPLKQVSVFGLTSAIITTLGPYGWTALRTHSRIAVIGGVLTVAVADAFSDALGIHIAEEAEDKHTHPGGLGSPPSQPL